MPSLHENTSPPSPTRRKALAWGLWAILGIIAASTLVPIVELASRRAAKKRLVYFPALAQDELPESGTVKAELNLRGGDRPDTRVFIRRAPGGELTAFLAICTHLGCLVGYNRVKGEFICPCHGGRYDSEGRPVAGPPPSPLARLPVKVAGGQVMVGFNV